MLLVASLVLAAFGISECGDFLLVDQCRDRGGAWEAEQGRCRF